MPNSIIQIKQTKQNFGIQFECLENGNLLYLGEDAFINKYLSAHLLTPSKEEILQFTLNVGDAVRAHIPLNGRSEHTGFLLDSQENQVGRFYQLGIGKNKYYCIEYKNQIFEIYLWSVGTQKLLLYDGQTQIGQVEKGRFVANKLDSYTLYLLDGYQHLHALFCFSVILFDKFEYGHQGEFFYGSENTATTQWSISGVGKSKYHKEFMSINFPEAGVESREMSFENIMGDIAYNAKEVNKATFTKRNFYHGFYSRFAIIFFSGCLALFAFLFFIVGAVEYILIPIIILVVYLIIGFNLKKSAKD